MLTRDTLIDRVWGADYVGDTKTLDVHIKRLRAKVEPEPVQARPHRDHPRPRLQVRTHPRLAGRSDPHECWVATGAIAPVSAPEFGALSGAGAGAVAATGAAGGVAGGGFVEGQVELVGE